METLQFNLNAVWVILCAVLVFMMQAGFMCLEAGLSQAKNSINIAIKNVADFILSVVLFWLVGFGIMFGQSWEGFLGTSHFALDSTDTWTLLFFVFQAVFVGTAATIDSGALSGRTKFSSYLIASGLVSCLIYPVFGHWAWGGLLLEGNSGWLESMGFIDFAGSTVVHSIGGWVALAGIVVVGPRIGRFNPDGSVNRIPPHNMTFAYLGTFILFFGWFGFNCGSTLEASGDIALIAINTLLSACTGGLASTALSWLTSPFKRPEGEMIANGILGGLVSITAGCASVGPTGAIMIGLIAGVLVTVSVYLMERLKLDDVVSAVPVHGICGAWGTLAVALFMRPELLTELNRLQLLGVQALGTFTAFIWSFGCAYLLFKLLDRTMGMRVTPDEEKIGLNISEHGASSTLLDLVHSMHKATIDNDFSDKRCVEVEHGTEMGDLAHGFNKMLEAIQHAIAETRLQVSRAEAAQRDAEEAHQRSEIQMRQLELEREKAEKAQLEIAHKEAESKQQLLEIRRITDELSLIMAATESSMNQISNSADNVKQNVDQLGAHSGDINQFIEKINALAYSTRLLSFNALIESAHAGDAGNTFKVVANQMKLLAQNTEEVTEQINDITSNMNLQLGSTTTSVEDQYASVRHGCSLLEKAMELVQNLLECKGAPLTEAHPPQNSLLRC